jgi:hypothetical protein
MGQEGAQQELETVDEVTCTSAKGTDGPASPPSKRARVDGGKRTGGGAAAAAAAMGTTRRMVVTRPSWDARGHTGYLTFARKFVTVV